MEKMLFNKCQTPLEELDLGSYPQEVQEQFWDFINNVPFIKWMVSVDRPYISELPRDEYGRAIIDVTHPPILEGSDYFRQTANIWNETGKYTHLRPNINPNSEFGRWLREEKRRGWEGFVNPETGMWVTGDYYWMLNYCPMHMVRKNESGLTQRIVRHPDFWDGQFLVSHYFHQARVHGHHAAELASRGKGKTTLGAAMLSKRFILGESHDNVQEIQCYVTAADRAKLMNPNQILTVFVDNIDFCTKHTQFDSRRLKSSNQEMSWKMGFNKSGSNVEYGSRNTVTGVITGVNQDKLNGSRGVLYLIEEAGIFKDLLNMYNMIRPSVEQGTDVFGLIAAYGTAGDDQSDFTAFAEMIYSPDGYNMEGLDNVFDKEGQGRRKITMFYPAYLNYDTSCIDKDGNSDVTKALLRICNDRYKIKYGTTDINTITKRISQYPVTPQEAIIRSQGNVFPVTELNERLNQIDNNPGEYDDVYVGDLTQDKEGKVKFEPSGDLPIRDFPTKDNKVLGALEIYSMPQKNSDGEVPFGRYIISLDPFDSDVAKTMSLGSCLVMDLWTDTLVAEYTGRPMFAEDLYEKVRLLCLFYNTRCMYEAHPYSQMVKTPDGVKRWGEVSIGDRLFSTNGRVVQVVDIPVNEYMPIYKVTLNDGREVLCSDNHIWSVYKCNHASKGLFNLTTKQMMEMGVKNKHGQNNFFIPNGGCVDYPHKDVPIDPYTLGLLIAEGAFTKFRRNKQNKRMKRVVQFSSSVEDAEFYKTVIPYPIKYVGSKGFSWHLFVDDIDEILDSLGLLHKNSQSKKLPDLYLYNDEYTRLELLKGLMDGDGCAKYGGASIYVTASPQLRDDFMSLCRSLGINCRCIVYKPNCMSSPTNNKIYLTQESYHIQIYTDKCIFKLPRKAIKQHIYKYGKTGCKANAYVNKIAIKSIEFSHYEMGKCVTINQADGLYMVGDYVVTHNCNIKGTYSYFTSHNSSHLLADTPEYLKERQLTSSIGYGNKAKGIHATTPIINGAFKMINSWLRKPTTRLEKDTEGNEHEITVPNLFHIRNRALLKELIQWNPYGNYDRVMSLVQLILYREEKMVLTQGNPKKTEEKATGLAADSYWTKNYPGQKQGIDQFSKLLFVH